MNRLQGRGLAAQAGAVIDDFEKQFSVDYVERAHILPISDIKVLVVDAELLPFCQMAIF